jgi:hypothetical protein
VRAHESTSGRVKAQHDPDNFFRSYTVAIAPALEPNRVST